MRGFGELETVVMDRIWDSGDTVTVRDVFEGLKTTREIAYTTVMSTMDNLYRKGWLDRDRQGKAYLYWPALSREEYSARLMREAMDSGGDPGLVLTRFLEQIDDGESTRLRKVVRRWASGTDSG
ncbi:MULTISPECIES: BlaI/MecI/CopY family transcriptional regulator [Prauserella salsuginis group]|uniref:BlaI/MecI/CopY family transcriptional regulator n=2 Tax=Prauserella salsuginis group TaxID=2893672 RepID=A0ABW6G8K5_9PSEU|nr:MULTISPECIES: BlaI/MecI/CopY family transcriptional regulator [Prauserella salsuginis group]MBB3663613.1 putative transcriptional regulator [Prauserella sediminis]MCR3722605.1 putative transcriptional regulator [Prauserella flava]MCR3737047.1 putative transcriptional regulator [Prauserella salsuginis]